MLGRRYKLSVIYEDGYADEHEFVIPFSPGTYELGVNVADTINPTGSEYAAEYIVVDKQQRTYEIGIAVADEVWGHTRPNWHYATFTTPSLTLEGLTWAEIAAISEAGKAKELFSVGDKKSLGNALGNAVIIGFDHDDLADGSGKAGITFAIENAVDGTTLSSLFPYVSNPTMMNSTNTNAGGWGESKMLKDTMNYLLPSIVPFKFNLSSIKLVNKAYVDTAKFPSTCEVKTAPSRFFLFSLVEVDEQYSETAGILPYKDEGTTYEYWKTNKPFGRLRTAHPDGSFFRIDDTGGKQSSNASDTMYPIQFGFCL